MRLRTFTLSFDPRVEAFDGEGVRAFMADKEVRSASEHFFVKGDTAYRALLLTYDMPPAAGEPVKEKPHRPKGEDDRSILSEPDWP